MNHRIRWLSRPLTADFADRTRGFAIMCFSATASFSVAATTAVIGLAAVARVRRPRELPLALAPMLFALQQVVEGVLWLQLTGAGDSGNVAELSFAFRLFAEVLWPGHIHDARAAHFVLKPMESPSLDDLVEHAAETRARALDRRK